MTRPFTARVFTSVTVPIPHSGCKNSRLRDRLDRHLDRFRRPARGLQMESDDAHRGTGLPLRLGRDRAQLAPRGPVLLACLRARRGPRARGRAQRRREAGRGGVTPRGDGRDLPGRLRPLPFTRLLPLPRRRLSARGASLPPRGSPLARRPAGAARPRLGAPAPRRARPRGARLRGGPARGTG